MGAGYTEAIFGSPDEILIQVLVTATSCPKGSVKSLEMDTSGSGGAFDRVLAKVKVK